MKKHAYLIMAHNNFYVLNKLILLLDDERNDIYIHIDKKVKEFDFDVFKKICKKSNLYFTKKRINVIWGHHSQVDAEMLLFKEAKNELYSFYHLISGTDLPLKNQDYIHCFFENNPKIELLEYQSKLGKWDLERIKYYNFNKRYRKFNFMNKISDYLVLVQRKLNIDRSKNIEVCKGSNWVTISNECLEYIMTQQRKINRITRFSNCADEIFLQTILKNTKFYERSSKYGLDNLRFIDWERGNNLSPYIFTSSDYEDLIKSDKLFARKFDENIDRDIIDKIFLELTQNKY